MPWQLAEFTDPDLRLMPGVEPTAEAATADCDAPDEVQVFDLQDGIVVRLQGALTSEHVPHLRRALLVPLPPRCRDVLIDASQLTAIDDAVLAVLLAAGEWAATTGRRFAALGLSAQLSEVLAELEMLHAFPTLASPRSSEPVGLPRQRSQPPQLAATPQPEPSSPPAR